MTELGEAKRKHHATIDKKDEQGSKEGESKEGNQDSDEAEIIDHSGTTCFKITIFYHFADCSENKEWTLKYSQMEAILFQEDHIREFFEKQTDIRIEAEKTLHAIIHQK